MPDETGKLSPAERQKIINYLISKKMPPPPCEFCGSSRWNIGEHLVLPYFYGTRLPSVVYPQFLLMCVTCGNTKHFSATVIPELSTPTTTQSEEHQKIEEAAARLTGGQHA